MQTLSVWVLVFLPGTMYKDYSLIAPAVALQFAACSSPNQQLCLYCVCLAPITQAVALYIYYMTQHVQCIRIHTRGGEVT
jgi:hypothetical protein